MKLVLTGTMERQRPGTSSLTGSLSPLPGQASSPLEANGALKHTQPRHTGKDAQSPPLDQRTAILRLPGWSKGEDLELPMQGAGVRSLVRELDPTCRNQEFACSN